MTAPPLGELHTTHVACYVPSVILFLLACSSTDAPWAWSKPTDPTITRDSEVVDTGSDTADTADNDTSDTSSLDTSETGADSSETSDTGAGDTSSTDTSDTGDTSTADTGATDTGDTSSTDTSDTSDTSTVDTADTGAADTSDTSTADTSDTGGSVTYTVAPDAPTDWVLEDLNPSSYRFGEAIPRAPIVTQNPHAWRAVAAARGRAQRRPRARAA